ncbi:hypothetical protein BGZ82_009505 [Podila clonocystis]|nr:hypothetical protein BGZ82_009505 [Podila clonocystis]
MTTAIWKSFEVQIDTLWIYFPRQRFPVHPPASPRLPRRSHPVPQRLLDSEKSLFCQLQTCPAIQLQYTPNSEQQVQLAQCVKDERIRLAEIAKDKDVELASGQDRVRRAHRPVQGRQGH